MTSEPKSTTGRSVRPSVFTLTDEPEPATPPHF